MNLGDRLDLHFADEAFKKASGRGPACISFWALADAPRDGLKREYFEHAQQCGACQHSLVLSMSSQCPADNLLMNFAMGKSPVYARGKDPLAAAIQQHIQTSSCAACLQSLQRLGLTAAAEARLELPAGPSAGIAGKALKAARSVFRPLRRMSPVLVLSCASVAILLAAATLLFTPVGTGIARFISAPTALRPPAPVLKDDLVVASYSPSGELILTVQAVPSEWRDRVRLMIQSKPLTQPPALARAVDATQSVAQVAGGEPIPSPGQEPVLLSPLQTAVATVHPTFRWTNAMGATNSTLMIADESGRTVLTQGVPGKTEFTLPANAPGLQPGRTYSWQVVAALRGEKRYSARGAFVLPDADTISTVAGLQREFANSAILLAAVDQTYALYDDAETQLHELKTRNPGTSLPQKLLDDLSARRHKTE